MSRDYYCSQKFRFLKIDLESQTTYNCHAARPHKIDFAWLASNPGQLFNTDVNVGERRMMLANERNSSCEQNCWPAEDRGAASPRLIARGEIRTLTEVVTSPEIIDITLNSDCNLTCSYCCKEYSSSWRNDVLKNGDYGIASEPDRYTKNNMDVVLARVSQQERFGLGRTQAILAEVKAMSANVKEIIISGGEPFLSRYLLDIVKDNGHAPRVQIFTGLGVDFKRFERIIDTLAEYKNIVLNVSGETTGALYEFNRYGATWDEFERKLAMLSEKNICVEISSVMSNLTVVGFVEFYKKFKNYAYRVECVYNPNFLAPHILDTATKDQVIEQFTASDFDKRELVLNSLSSVPTPLEKQDLKHFLTEFVTRRPGLGLDMFPKTFIEWLNNNVV
jgi:organic radical activating enzyme